MESEKVEEKIGKIYTRLEALKGMVHELSRTVFGNGVPGHEMRIGELEEVVLHKRKDTCPFRSDRANRYIVIGLFLNGLMTVGGFLSIIVTIKQGG